MTFERNNTMTFDATATEITVGIGGSEIVVPLDQATDFVMCVIEARKSGYAQKREANSAANAARKSERENKKVEREAAAILRANARVEKLAAQLAAAKKAAKKSGRKNTSAVTA